MKDRWKILWISVIFTIILSMLFLFLGFSFKKIQVGNYGIVMYSYYNTVDTTQSTRTSGNYLIGLDHQFIQYTKGFLSHQFTLQALTKDKSLIQIQGIYIGQLIPSQLVNLYMQYGNSYKKFLFSSVQQLARESLQLFSLNQLITNRASIQQFTSSYISSSVSQNYEFVSTRYISLGSLKTVLKTQSLLPETELLQNSLNKLNQLVQNQRKLNVYQSGGYDLLQIMESKHSTLFFNVTQRLRRLQQAVTNSSATYATLLLQAVQYAINSKDLPTLSNTIPLQITK